MTHPTNEKRSWGNLSRRLQEAGLTKTFISSVLLPDWWTEEYEAKSPILSMIEFTVARLLKLPLSVVADPTATLTIIEVSLDVMNRLRADE